MVEHKSLLATHEFGVEIERSLRLLRRFIYILFVAAILETIVNCITHQDQQRSKNIFTNIEQGKKDLIIFSFSAPEQKYEHRENRPIENGRHVRIVKRESIQTAQQLFIVFFFEVLTKYCRQLRYNCRSEERKPLGNR